MGIEILPCCVDCKTGYVPFKNDIAVLEMMSDEHSDPYKLWSADLLECPKCNHRIITGFGNRAIAEHYQPDFTETVDKYVDAGILFTIGGKRGAMRTWDKKTN